jgi:hypothetical protein
MKCTHTKIFVNIFLQFSKKILKKFSDETRSEEKLRMMATGFEGTALEKRLDVQNDEKG